MERWAENIEFITATYLQVHLIKWKLGPEKI
jgi:hypothetical protein